MYETVNLKNMLFGEWQNILNVKRLATHQTINSLSVAEHSWLTAMLVMRMCDEILYDKYEQKQEFTNMRNYDRLLLAKRNWVEVALIHDLEECIIGDIPRVPCARGPVKEAKNETIEKIDSWLFDDQEGLKYGKLRKDLNEDEDGYRMVHYADMYSLLIECTREIQIGNMQMVDIAQKVMFLMKSFVDNPPHDHGSEILDQVDEYIKANYYNTQAVLAYQWKVTSLTPCSWCR